MLRRRTCVTFVAMWAVSGVMIAIARACGPAATPAATNQASPATPTPTIWWLGDTPSPSEFATLEAMPTPTPYPPGYVKPTDPPYSPPRHRCGNQGHAGSQHCHRGGAMAQPSLCRNPYPGAYPHALATDYTGNAVCPPMGSTMWWPTFGSGPSRNVTLPANFEWPANTKPWDELTRNDHNCHHYVLWSVAGHLRIDYPAGGWVGQNQMAEANMSFLSLNRSSILMNALAILFLDVVVLTGRQLNAMGGPRRILHRRAGLGYRRQPSLAKFPMITRCHCPRITT